MILDSGKTETFGQFFKGKFESVVILDSGKTAGNAYNVRNVFESVVILDGDSKWNSYSSG